MIGHLWADVLAKPHLQEGVCHPGLELPLVPPGLLCSLFGGHPGSLPWELPPRGPPMAPSSQAAPGPSDPEGQGQQARQSWEPQAAKKNFWQEMYD